MLYFAYGSNMSLPRLKARVPSAFKICNAELAAHELRWHKKSHDGSAKCDMAATGNEEDTVYGVVFDIDPTQKADLDICEGLGKGYETKTVQLIDANGDVMEAYTYYATDIDASLRPYRWYLHHVLAGAQENGLPTHYMQQLQSVVAIDDPNAERHDREMQIYR